MESEYKDVVTRFLRDDERLMVSDEKEMPLVIEAKAQTNLGFLHNFLKTNSPKILHDLSKYGAVLLRGFDVASDEDFENTVLSIQGFKGISEAFMSEQGRIHVGDLKYVLHTNAVYKTGGTLYLGGFHSENYYTPDVPTYICFCCLQPSQLGGETGLVNMEKVYPHLSDDLKQRLEKNSFFVSKWLLSEVEKRYKISAETIEKICQSFDLPIVSNGSDKYVLMYKPSVFIHPETKKRSLQINLFELETLNLEMRKHFVNDYHGKEWFWHRFFWRMPKFMLKLLEYSYMIIASLRFSPKEAMQILQTKINTYTKNKQHKLDFNAIKVGSCFSDQEVKMMAKLIRQYYCSTLWQKGDVLLVDNRKVVHAGMPGAGPRLIRAMICNPIEMKYSFVDSGVMNFKNRERETVGHYMEEKEYHH